MMSRYYRQASVENGITLYRFPSGEGRDMSLSGRLNFIEGGVIWSMTLVG